MLSRKGRLLCWWSRLGTDLQFLNHETQFVSTLGTIATVSLDDLTRRFQFKPGVEEVAALGTYYSLRRQIVERTSTERKFSYPVLKQFQKRERRRTAGKQGLLLRRLRSHSIRTRTSEGCSSWA
jgi:hypothetical protein